MDIHGRLRVARAGGYKRWASLWQRDLSGDRHGGSHQQTSRVPVERIVEQRDLLLYPVDIAAEQQNKSYSSKC